MFVDFDPARDWGGYDYIIIGAGVAGLFLARKLAGAGRVLVIEAGRADLSNSTGAGYYELDVTGRGYTPIGQRLSALGGTSNHWGGHSHPLNPVIFGNRKGFPGWPIAYADYALHLPEAQDWLNLGAFSDTREKTGVERDLLGHAQNLGALHFQFSNPIRRLGDDATRTQFAAEPGIDIVFDTRVVDIHLDAGGGRVDRLDLFHLSSRRTASVPVSQLFLAAGGIENPRLMLWSARKYRPGNPLAGGPNALTGKFFMEHPSIEPVEIYIDSRADISALAPHPFDNLMVNVVLRAGEDFLSAHGLPRFGMHFQDQAQPATNDIELQAAQDFFVSRSVGYQRIMPFFIFEQTPNAASFVGLSSKLGSDGTPLARLNWYIPPEEIASYRRSVLLFCGLLNQYGLAKTRFVGDGANPDWTNIVFGDACHHMGTTRMAHDASGGVVDPNSQVFGLSNMYVAGSSVFPSTDIVNPTLNLTALTARLANFVLNKAATAVGAIYRFGKGRDADKALGQGWATPEFAGVWSSGDTADVTLARHGAKTLTLAAGATDGVTVDLSINGAAAYSGPASGLAGKPLPAGDADQLALAFNFTGLPPKRQDGARTGLFLQTVTLQ
ncbi:MAG TPA: GMC oxidoreductase [Devosia sp.]|nr:GMC oxidoreductase [Devosia sp.]